MNRRLAIDLLAFLLASSSRAQVFEKSFEGSDSQFGTAIQVTSDGGSILAGSTLAFGIGAGIHFNVYLVRTNGNGDTLWTRTFGGAEDDQGYAVDQTSDGGFVVAGSTKSFGTMGSEAYLIRTDANGDLLWSKTYGGPGEEVGFALALTPDGGAIVVGASGFFGGVGGGANCYVIRTDAVGDTLWTRAIHSFSDNFGLSVNEVPGGDHIISGVDAVGGGRIELYRMDDNGNMIWNKALTAGFSSGYSAIPTTDGGFMVCGNFGNAACLVKTDAAGDTLWSKTYDGVGPDYGYWVRQTPDGGYVFSGQGSSKTWLVRTDNQGDTLWQHTYSSGTATENEVVLTADGGFAISANRWGSGSFAMQLVRTGADGWIPCNMENPAVVVEEVSPTVTSPTLTISSYGEVNAPATLVGSGALVLTHCISGAGVWDQEPLNDFEVYPNPAEGHCSIALADALNIGMIQMIDAQGAVVMSHATHGRSHIDLQVAGLAPGLYVVRATSASHVYSARLVLAR